MATPWGRVFLVFGLGVVAAMQLGIIAPAAPLLRKELGLSLPFVGWAISAITLAPAVLGLAAGSFTERIGHARAVKIGLAAMAVLAGGCALAGDGTTLLLARILAGGGYLLVVAAAPSLLAAIEKPADRALALSIWSIFVPVGIALAGVLSSLLLGRIGWRGLFWADAALTAAATVVAALAVREERPPVGVAPPPWSVLRRRAPALLAIGFCAFTLTFLAIAALLPSYLIAARGATADGTGRLIAVTTLFTIPGGIAAGWLMRRGLSVIALAVAGLVAPALATLVMFWPEVPGAWVAVATAIAFGLGELAPAAIYVAIPQYAASPGAIAPMNGLLAQLGSLGTLVGPPLFAAWTGLAGWSLGPLLLIAVAAAGSAALLLVRRPETHAGRA